MVSRVQVRHGRRQARQSLAYHCRTIQSRATRDAMQGYPILRKQFTEVGPAEYTCTCAKAGPRHKAFEGNPGWAMAEAAKQETGD